VFHFALPVCLVVIVSLSVMLVPLGRRNSATQKENQSLNALNVALHEENQGLTRMVAPQARLIEVGQK
jgi:hypothetical protein